MRPDLEVLVQGVEPFKVTSTKLLYDAPPVKYLIEGILPTHSICGLTGSPGTGKTWLAMEMMRAAITGTKFLGQFETRQAPVLLVGSDASLLDYAQQWRRLTREAYDSYGEIGVENPFDKYGHFLIQSEFNLDDVGMVARLIRTSEIVERPSFVEDVMGEDGWEQIEREGRHYGLIIYDTLVKMTSTPENDNVGRNTVFNHLRDIAEATGATLLVLHHPTLVSEFRTGEEWRGAGSQFGNLDAHYHILRDGGRLDVIQFKVKKFRGITPKPFLFHLDVHESDADADLTFMEPAKDAGDHDAKLLERLVQRLKNRNNEPTTVADFAIDALQDPETHEEFQGDVKRMKRRIQNMLDRETKKPDPPIVRITVGRGRTGSLYKLAPEVKE